MTAAKPGGLARAFSALFGASAFSMAAQLVRGKLAAVLLGPAGVGVFNQLSVMWNLFQIGGSMGAFNGLVQHGTEALVADDRDGLRRLASTWSLLLAVVSCLFAAAGVIAAAPLSDLCRTMAAATPGGRADPPQHSVRGDVPGLSGAARRRRGRSGIW